MKKGILRWLLSATVSCGIFATGMQYVYGADTQAATYSTSYIFEEDESVIDYVNEQIVNQSSEIVIKVYSADYDVYGLMDIIESADCYCDLEKAGFKFYGSGNILTCTITATYRTTEAQNKELTAAIAEVIKELDLDGKTEYQKVKAIHDYICDNVDYDYEHLSQGDDYPGMFTAYAAMFDGKAICQGYATLFYRMCDEAGISAKIITGDGNGESHAWNIVKIGDEYYNIDTTWDGQESYTVYDFFLKNADDFIAHYRNSIYDTAEFNEKYPMTSGSWIDFGTLNNSEGLNVSNLGTVSYTTIEGETVTNQAEGKPKVLILGDINCVNTRYYVSVFADEISAKNFNGADFIFVDCRNNSLEAVEAFEQEYIQGAMPAAYSTGDEYWDNLWDYNYRLGGGDTVGLPLMIYIDENNVIQHTSMEADFSIWNISNIGKESAKLLNTQLELQGGETARLDVSVYDTQRNGQFFTWTSSNESIASVDENGLVKGLKGGTATITCKVNENISLTCEVVVTTLNGLNKSSDGVWRYYTDGEVDTTYTGMAKNKYGWWYVTNGELDLTYTGMAKNSKGWWYMKNGKLDRTYTGLATNAYGTWYMRKGQLDTTYTAMIKVNSQWRYIKNGKLDLTYTGMAKNSHGWWYMKNGKLDLTYTGMAKNSKGWWYMKNGKLYRTYTGLATNAY